MIAINLQGNRLSKMRQIHKFEMEYSSRDFIMKHLMNMMNVIPFFLLELVCLYRRPYTFHNPNVVPISTWKIKH